MSAIEKCISFFGYVFCNDIFLLIFVHLYDLIGYFIKEERTSIDTREYTLKRQPFQIELNLDQRCLGRREKAASTGCARGLK